MLSAICAVRKKVGFFSETAAAPRRGALPAAARALVAPGGAIC
jgi:hypothetical protein